MCRCLVDTHHASYLPLGTRRIGHYACVSTGSSDVTLEVSGLIDAWCDRRELDLLARLLPAWVSNNGLIDGWAEVLDALKRLRGRPGIAGAEADVIERSIIEVERAVYRP